MAEMIPLCPLANPERLQSPTELVGRRGRADHRSRCTYRLGSGSADATISA